MTLMSVIVAFLFAISLWYLSSNHKVTFVKLKATNLKFLPNRGWHGLIPAGGTFVSATGGTFQSDTPGTFVSAMGGTFDSDIPGTFESATGGTFNPLLSLLALVDKTFGHPAGTPADFVALSSSVFSATREYLSDSTLKRLHKPALSYNTVSERTLNVLAKYIGRKHFDDFCDFLSKNGEAESDIVQTRGSVKSAELRPGDTFSCLSFTVGRPLYVLLGGEKERSYGMGLTHGLSSIVKEPAI